MYWKLGWREIRRHPGRALLTLASVVIAVAGVVSVSFTSQTTSRAFDDIYQTIAGRADLEVSAEIGDTFDESVLEKIEAVPGVKAAAPLIQRWTVLYIGPKGTKMQALGIDTQRDKAIHDYELVEGKSLAETPGIMLHTELARSLGLKVNDPVELQTRLGIRPTRVVGLYKLHGTATTGQGAVMLMPLSAAQALFKTRKKLDSVQVVLDPDASLASVKNKITALLPPGVTVHPPAARSPMAEETSLSTEQGMNMAREFSLLLAIFIIANTFLIGVTQLKKQLGIMRAIGATRGQVARLVFGQAIFMGIVGTVLGSVLGVFVAHFLSRAMGALYVTTLPPIELKAEPFLWAAVVGLGISLAGAALPARKAAHASPMEAIRDSQSGGVEGVARWLVFLGAAMVIVCGGVLAASITGALAMEAAVWGAVLLLIGLVFLLPLGLSPLANMAAWLLAPWMRCESRLACRQLVRHRSRTTLTVGVVFIAISTGIGLANSVIDNVNDVRSWYRKTIIADFFVRAMAPDMATGLAADLPDAVDPEIRKIPGITSLDAVRFVSVKAAGEQVVMIVRSFDDPELQEFDLVSGDPQTVRDSLRKGEVVVGSVLAERAKLKVGDEITLDTKQGVHQFRIAAVTNDYQSGGLTIYIDRETAKQFFEIQGVDAYVIKADHERLQEVKHDLQELVDKHRLLLQSFSDIQHSIDAMMAGVVAGLWGMVVLGLVVAAFGVTNTLMMTVLEQTREFGLLRVVAMTRNQVRKTVFAQALVMGILALVPGVVAGVGVAYLIHLATEPVIGHPVKFEPHPWLLASGLVFGLIIVTLAAWLPAERASRLELTEALRTA